MKLEHAKRYIISMEKENNINQKEQEEQLQGMIKMRAKEEEANCNIV